MLARHDMEPVTIAGLRDFPTGENDELDSCGELLGVFPTGQGVPLVTAHDPVELGVGKFFRHGLGGLIGIGRTLLVEFKIIDKGPWKFCGGAA